MDTPRGRQANRSLGQDLHDKRRAAGRRLADPFLIERIHAAAR
jgi:hypothetical protein